jgi:DNA topoisomerase-2
MSRDKVDDKLKEFDYFTVEQHIRSKAMWLGAKQLAPYEEWIYDHETKQFDKKTMEFSSALVKTLWELTCNAIDASIKNKRVKNIYLGFDRKTGVFSIFNDGGSIPIIFDKRVNQWLPTAVATNPFSGSNLKDDKQRRTGGTNGLGLKLCNFFASKLLLEAYDGKHGFAQTFSERMKKISEPVVVSWSQLEKKDRFERVYIEYTPFWEGFSYPAKPSVSQLKDIERIVEAMAYQTAAYVRKDIVVKFNDKEIKIKSLQDYANKFCDKSVGTLLKHKTDPWDLIVGVHDGGSPEYQTFINGIYVRAGDHIKKIENLIVEALKEKTQRILKENKTTRFNRNMIVNHLFIFIRGSVPDPEFDGQRKDTLRKPPAAFKDYTLPPAFINKLWAILQDQILATYAQKQLDADQSTNKKKKLNIPDLRDADAVLDGTGSRHTRLIISEGNTADTMVRRLLLSDKSLGFKYYGTYNLRGVPVNARKMTKVVRTVKIRDKKWDNETNRLRNLAIILGLDFSKTYEKEEDIKKLRYGGAIMAVDQDIDGVGNIMSLTLNCIDLFWPGLLKHKYFKHLATPLIRVYPKFGDREPLEFYSERLYDVWKQKLFKGSEPPTTKYRIKYYKGLGTHDKHEVKHMSATLDKHIISLEGDELSPKLFEAFFGKLANVRKVELAKPMKTYPEYDDKLVIPCSIHLMRDTKNFQNEKNYRNLKCASDGLNPSRRKILMGALDEFGKSNEAMKVFQFGGAVAKEYQYHNGDASLNGTIIRMAQYFIGSNNFPILLGDGEFGTRLEGGGDAGQPRYIEVSINKKLVNILYPSDDRYILEYNFDDGKRSEPKEWPSILPMTLLERSDGIGTGWSQTSWARDVYQVIENVKRKIEGKDLKPMGPESYNFKGIFRVIDGVEYCCGMYKIIREKLGRTIYDTIHITELPLGTWSKTYITWLREKKEDLIYDIREQCGDFVDIKIFLKKDMLKQIETKYGNKQFTAVEDCFQLTEKMNVQLNFTDKDGRVHTYKSYEEVFNAWYEIRKKMYEYRINRLDVMTKLRIKFMENIIRFIEIYKSLGIAHKPEDFVLKTIKENKFDKFTKSPESDPKYVPTDKLVEIYTGEGAGYDYLVSLSTRDMYVAQLEKYKKQLQDYKNTLKDIKDLDGKFIGAKWWLRELDQFIEVLKEGRKTEWRFEHVNYWAKKIADLRANPEKSKSAKAAKKRAQD